MEPKLGLKDRPFALEKLKSKTKRSDCGRVGHWVGDPECEMSRKSKFGGIADIGSEAKNSDSSKTD
eukprot:10327053-Karenia_brevis.AAC.1